MFLAKICFPHNHYYWFLFIYVVYLVNPVRAPPLNGRRVAVAMWHPEVAARSQSTGSSVQEDIQRDDSASPSINWHFSRVLPDILCSLSNSSEGQAVARPGPGHGRRCMYPVQFGESHLSSCWHPIDHARRDFSIFRSWYTPWLSFRCLSSSATTMAPAALAVQLPSQIRVIGFIFARLQRYNRMYSIAAAGADCPALPWWWSTPSDRPPLCSTPTASCLVVVWQFVGAQNFLAK